MNRDYELKPLLQQPVSLFDSRGGVLDVDGKYAADWWNVGDVILTGFNSKYIYLYDPTTEKKTRLKANRITEIYKNHITLNG